MQEPWAPVIQLPMVLCRCSIHQCIHLRFALFPIQSSRSFAFPLPLVLLNGAEPPAPMDVGKTPGFGPDFAELGRQCVGHPKAPGGRRYGGSMRMRRGTHGEHLR